MELKSLVYWESEETQSCPCPSKFYSFHEFLGFKGQISSISGESFIFPKCGRIVQKWLFYVWLNYTKIQFLQPFHMWIMLFNPDFFETTTRYTVWIFDGRNMVAIIHPAVLYFAYINDPLIHLRGKKVNLFHQPLQSARLDAGVTLTRLHQEIISWSVCITALILLDVPTNISRNSGRKKNCSRETNMC